MEVGGFALVKGTFLCRIQSCECNVQDFGNSLILQNICIRQDEVNFSIMKCGRELFVLTDALL